MANPVKCALSFKSMSNLFVIQMARYPYFSEAYRFDGHPSSHILPLFAMVTTK